MGGDNGHPFTVADRLGTGYTVGKDDESVNVYNAEIVITLVMAGDDTTVAHAS